MNYRTVEIIYSLFEGADKGHFYTMLKFQAFRTSENKDSKRTGCNEDFGLYLTSKLT